MSEPYLIEERHEFVDSFGQRIYAVHSKAQCKIPKQCVIHSPTNHHMKTWPLLWRPDRRIFERICSHGIGHPDPDDMTYQIGYLELAYVDIHGCDGCCATERVEIDVSD